MPLYQTLITVKPHLTPAAMAKLAKSAARVVLADGGIVRDVYNIGFKRLPHRRTQKGVDEYWSYGRLYTLDYCSSVETMRKVETHCTDESEYLRHHTVRHKHALKKIVRVTEQRAFAEGDKYVKRWKEDTNEWVGPAAGGE